MKALSEMIANARGISPNFFRDRELSDIFWSHPGLKFDELPDPIKQRIDSLVQFPVDAASWERFWLGGK